MLVRWGSSQGEERSERLPTRFRHAHVDGAGSDCDAGLWGDCDRQKQRALSTVSTVIPLDDDGDLPIPNGCDNAQAPMNHVPSTS